ncbi:hypothetical protein Syun_016779 [Stephania yunnanensis]|uniref:RecA family profile 1 domain-containing protein n=1 Tax=Stephania yunnanensis TaxID=152371 RepID=A0AAP0J823_9MAGN
MTLTPENLVSHLPVKKCTLGCPILDGLLGGGGIPCNSITEIFGESGCGKTQLCLQLLLSAQLPHSLGGLSASSLYLHSELPFPLRRLHHLSTTILNHNNNNPLDNILVRPLHSADDLLSLLLRLDSLLLLSPSPLPIKLIVIDSIAVLFRSEFDNSPAELRRRSNLFFRIAGMLKMQARRFGLAVVVTNQVVDLVESEGFRVGNLGGMWSSGRRVGAALGMAWASCVNSRLFLSRSDEVVGREGDGELRVRTRRRIHVVFAPHLPEGSCEYQILREGVFGVRL